MKRYKVVEDVRKDIETNYGLVIPAGTEICLEEVEEHKELKYCGCSGCRKASDETWKNVGKMLDEEVKEEKCRCDQKKGYWIGGDDYVCEKCNLIFHLSDQPKEEEEDDKLTEGATETFLRGWLADKCRHGVNGGENCEKCNQDQPLTPKDVGLGKVEALGMFMDWCYQGNRIAESFWGLSDPEFDRLYQIFLKEKLTDK